jgi:hypothetical protein
MKYKNKFVSEMKFQKVFVVLSLIILNSCSQIKEPPYRLLRSDCKYDVCKVWLEYKTTISHAKKFDDMDMVIEEELEELFLRHHLKLYCKENTYKTIILKISSITTGNSLGELDLRDDPWPNTRSSIAPGSLYDHLKNAVCAPNKKL